MAEGDGRGLERGVTLEQWAGNGDGTYNTARVAQFLIFAATGSRITDAEAAAIVEEARAKAAARRK